MNLTFILFISSLIYAAEESAISAGVSPFDHLDADADGVITREEVKFVPNLYNQYDAVDSDESGTIDQVEFSAFELQSEDNY